MRFLEGRAPQVLAERPPIPASRRRAPPRPLDGLARARSRWPGGPWRDDLAVRNPLCQGIPAYAGAISRCTRPIGDRAPSRATGPRAGSTGTRRCHRKETWSSRTGGHLPIARRIKTGRPPRSAHRRARGTARRCVSGACKGWINVDQDHGLAIDDAFWRPADYHPPHVLRGMLEQFRRAPVEVDR